MYNGNNTQVEIIVEDVHIVDYFLKSNCCCNAVEMQIELRIAYRIYCIGQSETYLKIAVDFFFVSASTIKRYTLYIKSIQYGQ